MRDHGHDPCLVLQTSPGRLQAWIRVSASPLEPCIATAIARQSARDYRGDPASADWRHLGRLAGFTNQKATRRTARGYAPWVKIVHAHPALAPNANTLIESARNLWRPSWLAALSGSDGSPPPPRTALIGSTEATRIYHHCLRQWRIAQRFSPPDWSIVDL
jgi:hypothetical protein